MVENNIKHTRMRKFLPVGFLIPIFLLFYFPAKTQDRPIVFKGALIYPVAGPAIEKGVLVVQHGHILAVGDASTAIPADAQVIDATNKVIIPGIIDTHSHIGGPEGGDNSNALNHEVRVLNTMNPASTGFKNALAGGITTS